MTGRERLLQAIAGKPVDRVPIAPFIHVNFVKAFFEGREVDPVTATVDVYEHFGLDLIHRNCTPAYNELGTSCGNWQVENRVEEHGPNTTTVTTIRTPGGELRQVHQLSRVSEYDAESAPVEYLVKSERDFELVEAYQPPVERIDTTPIARARAAVGDRGIVAPWMQGAFNHVAYYYRPVDECIVDAIDNPALYRRLMEHFLARNKQVAAQYVEAGADVLSYSGNIASGKMVGGPFFGRHVLSYENDLIGFIQDKGVPVLYHNCGYAKGLFPHYRRLRAQIYESLTPPPYGDTILDEALQEMPSDMVLHGGVDQIGFLMTASPDGIQRHVRELLAKASERGRFILGTSDYLHEATPHENVHALAPSLQAG